MYSSPVKLNALIIFNLH